MRLRVYKAHMQKALLATAFAFGFSISSGAASQTVDQINLTTDDQAFLISQGFAPANNVDPNLINPWGMSFSTTSPFWLSDQGAGVSTLYTGAGAPVPLVVTVASTRPRSSSPQASATRSTV